MKTLLSVLAFALTAQAATPASSPKTVLETFYRDYFASLSESSKTKPTLHVSKSLQTLIDKDAAICRDKANGDVCGFGADGDIYLDAQDHDDKLTLKTTKFKARETAKKGDVEVSFNVMPSQKKDKGARKITYRMIEENGAWVVDNILYAKSSARQQMLDEIDISSRERTPVKAFPGASATGSAKATATPAKAESAVPATTK